MHRPNILGIENPPGKVSEVLGDNRSGSDVECGGEDMAIVGVGEVKLLDEVLVSGGGGVGDGDAHEAPRPVEHGWVEVGPVGAEVAEVSSRRLRSSGV
ncbi:MAG: hypothetical protein ACRDPS_21330 [Nocardioides sp.]|uniref:hypothetical protein n=1 Tax=Nocardioides sp. TaxID=35761 RepID=UPI003D6BBF79